MNATDDEDFVAYVAGRLPVLRRVATQLAGDAHRGDDLVQQAITRLFTHWRRARRTENLDAYVYRILTRVFLDERRLRWASVRLRAAPADLEAGAGSVNPAAAGVEDRILLRQALATLPPRQRAILVLRFLADRPVPSGMYPAMTLTQQEIIGGRPSRVAFNLGFDAVGTAAPTHIAGYVPYPWVNANSYATIDHLPEGATAYTEDLGFPAFRSDLRNEGRDSDLLLVYDFFGFGVEIEPRGLRAARDEKLRYAADIFRTMTVFPGAATDPSVWREPTC